MASEKVADLAALFVAERQKQETDEFKAYLADRVANARRIEAAKKVKGQPLPQHLLGGKELFHVEPSPETPTKTCKCCKRSRPVVLFPPRQTFGDSSRNSVCQLCLSTKAKKEKKEAIARGYALPPQKLITLEQRALRMWSAVRLRAWRANVPFCMRKKWVEDRLRAGRCEVTGLPFSEYGGSFDNYMASIDREVPEKGYTESNCRMVVWQYNAAKGSGTHKDVLRMAKALIETEKAARKRQARARAAAAGEAKVGEAA